MASIPLRVASSFPLIFTLATLSTQALAPAQANVAPQAGDSAKPAAPDAYAGLPKFLREVPGGPVHVGLSTRELLDAACQTAFPSRPDQALKVAEKNVKTAMSRSASLLGPSRVEVETFLLGEWPVKNSEYEVFVALSRQEGSSIRPVLPPFGWWRYGREDDYNKRLGEINKMFPKDREGPRHYWEQKGHELPYKLQDDKGNSIAEQPVGYISFTAANRFAAWLGMRLPSEYEWVRAARGDAKHRWPWGAQGQDQDKFTGKKSLESLQLYSSQNKVRKDVGTVKGAIGPFGHVDMFGNAWQLVADLGFYPIGGTDAFADEYKLLKKDKLARDLLTVKIWKDQKALAKGGSFLSGDDPIQLMIDQRAPMGMDDALESVGFRLAKSLRPGYDTLFSLLRGVYNRNRFLPDQQPMLENQFGAERYELGANGFPTAYHTVSFAPANWLAKGKSADLKKLMADSHRRPLALGTLVTTEKIAGFELKDQIFSVFYRSPGQPRELTDAIKRGHREVQAEIKAAAQRAKAGLKDKKDDKKKDDKKKDDKKGKANDWRQILQRYGLGAKDLEPKEAKNGLDFVRLDGVEIKTDRGAYLLQGNDGKIVAAIPAPNARPALDKATPGTIELKAADGKMVTRLGFGVPLVSKNPGRVVTFTFDLPLDRPAVTAEKPWRLPN